MLALGIGYVVTCRAAYPTVGPGSADKVASDTNFTIQDGTCDAVICRYNYESPDMFLQAVSFQVASPLIAEHVSELLPK